MTHDEMLAVIAAHRDGKNDQLEQRNLQGGAWGPCYHGQYGIPGFDFANFAYRIAPEPVKPREWWIAFYDDNGRIFGRSEQTEIAVKAANPFANEFVHVIEVLPTSGEQT